MWFWCRWWRHNLRSIDVGSSNRLWGFFSRGQGLRCGSKLVPPTEADSQEQPGSRPSPVGDGTGPSRLRSNRSGLAMPKRGACLGWTLCFVCRQLNTALTPPLLSTELSRLLREAMEQSAWGHVNHMLISQPRPR